MHRTWSGQTPLRRLVLGVCAGVALAGCGRRPPRDLAAEGLDALAAGRYAQAVKRIEQALVNHPESVSLHYNLATAYWRLGQTDRAMATFESTLRLAPADRDAWLFKGHLLMQQQQWEDARVALAQAVHHGGSDPVVLTAIARAEAGLGHHETAQEFLQAALNRAPDYQPARYNLASLYRDALNAPEPALELFTDFYRRCEDPVYREKAHAAIRRLQTTLAGATHDAPPSQPDTTPPDAAAQPQAEAPAETPEPIVPEPIMPESVLEDAPSRPTETPPEPPSTVSPHERLAQAEADASAGRWDAAVSGYRRYLEHHSMDAATWYRLGLASHAAGRIPDAITAFRRTAEVDARHAPARYMLAVLHREQGQTAAAVAAIDEVLRIDPDHAQAYLLMAYLRFDEGNYRAARGHLMRFIELAEPGDARRQAQSWLDRIPHR